jgi:hypothetical protein
MVNIHRRGLLLGLASALAAPAIVHAGNLMPVKAIKLAVPECWIVKGYDMYMNPVEEMIPVSIANDPKVWSAIYSDTKFKRIGSIIAPGGFIWSKEEVSTDNKIKSVEVYSANSELWYTPRA